METEPPWSLPSDPGELPKTCEGVCPGVDPPPFPNIPGILHGGGKENAGGKTRRVWWFDAAAALLLPLNAFLHLF